MGSYFRQNISKYTELIIILTFALILAPDKVKIIKNLKVGKYKQISVSIKDIVFVIFLISMIIIIISCLKKK